MFKEECLDIKFFILLMVFLIYENNCSFLWACMVKNVWLFSLLRLMTKNPMLKLVVYDTFFNKWLQSWILDDTIWSLQALICFWAEKLFELNLKCDRKLGIKPLSMQVGKFFYFWILLFCFNSWVSCLAYLHISMLFCLCKYWIKEKIADCYA